MTSLFSNTSRHKTKFLSNSFIFDTILLRVKLVIQTRSMRLLVLLIKQINGVINVNGQNPLLEGIVRLLSILGEWFQTLNTSNINNNTTVYGCIRATRKKKI